jgi:uncharacterized protein YdhG (YjbR/CyaY superfamily)
MTASNNDASVTAVNAATAYADEYLAGLPDDQRIALQGLREVIKAAAPEAVEAVSYQMPAFKYRGKPLAYYAAFKDHCSLFPASSAAIAACAGDLAGYRASKGTVQFTPERPLPEAVVKKIVQARMAEIDATAKRRAS